MIFDQSVLKSLKMWPIKSFLVLSLALVSNTSRPPFENVVMDKYVKVTPSEMTCGLNSTTKYCVTTTGIYRDCDVCDDSDENKRHPAKYLTDTENNKTTWWQSVTMKEDVHVQPVNLTVNLGKSYVVTYVFLKFQSPRPFSFAIYKKNRQNPAQPDPNPDEDWIPWQYYSASCQDEYNVQDQLQIQRGRQDVALCTSEYSNISPLTGANVAFSTLDGRPSAYDFKNSPELQSWVSATDIRISLKRLNTFGDEVFGDPKVLQSYYYAISDFRVGGRCQCNGHASLCGESNGQEGTLNTSKTCLCQHNTTGPDCEKCAEGYFGDATKGTENDCQPCNCDPEGSDNQLCTPDGRCSCKPGATGDKCDTIVIVTTTTTIPDCGGNRDGEHCDRCKPNHFFSMVTNDMEHPVCKPCNCDPIGSESQQCNLNGKCTCKPGVSGDKCDTIANDDCQYCTDCKIGEDTSSPLARTPWISSIGYISESNWIHNCIGSIIGNNMILAPAKCLQDFDQNSTKVKVGSEFLTTMNNSSVYDVAFVEFHPEFNDTLDFNIAILYTAEPIEFTDRIMPICVPKVPKEHDALKGKAVLMSYYSSMQLKLKLMPVNSNLYCEEFDFSFQSHHLCAGKVGGLGSPIVQYNLRIQPNFYQLIGLRIDEEDNEERGKTGFFIRLNHPKVLAFVLNALQQ